MKKILAAVIAACMTAQGGCAKNAGLAWSIGEMAKGALYSAIKEYEQFFGTEAEA